ncbi:endoplasmic reticulum-Golgi intermediate compartment protein 2 isoform X2 [Tachypleus tridentatus]|uniref:endoplasmic reticulum-Golgi intermediate compartment protein 2 isoform X2 n=1 Tax=Tachypleus tridentatus TaxID=6853 RepID=UPI003FD50941
MDNQLLRRSVGKKVGLRTIKELDSFTKVSESYTQSSISGGTISVISFTLIAVLVISEIVHYTSGRVKFHYTVDREFDRKLKINIDITVAMPCAMIGADVLDVTNQNAQTFGKLEQVPTQFSLSHEQRMDWEMLQQLNTHIRQQYHAIQDIIWNIGFADILTGISASELEPMEEADACRLYGTLVVNKVAGNFHITAGKIQKFSFGDEIEIIDPLAGDEKIAPENYYLYQYYLKIVPTEVDTSRAQVNTFQYSVTEQERSISHQAGSHGVPGIYFKYDMSSVMVKVLDERQTLWQFLVRLCGIVGGIYATSGIITGLTQFLIDLITCKFLTSTMKNGKTFIGNDMHIPIQGLVNTFTEPQLLGTSASGTLLPAPAQEEPNYTEKLFPEQGIL